MKKLLAALSLATLSAFPANAQDTNLYWGDTHLHTANSMDAYFLGNRDATPDAAYRWAKGLPVINASNRTLIQIETPLDFLVVSDHAEALGVMRAIMSETEELEDLSFWGEIKRWIALDTIRRQVADDNGAEVFQGFLPNKAEHPGTDPVVV